MRAKIHQGASMAEAAYWTIASLPRWLLARASGWNTFSFMHVLVQKTILGGLSKCVADMLKIFFGTASASFATGFYLLDPAGNKLFFRGEVKFFVQDEKAMKFLWDVKGASGFKPCYMCRNIVNTDAARVDAVSTGYVRLMSTCKPAHFHLHTRESFFGACDRIESQRPPVLTNGRFKDLQKTHGINWAPHGVIFDRECRRIKGSKIQGA